MSYHSLQVVLVRRSEGPFLLLMKKICSIFLLFFCVFFPTGRKTAAQYRLDHWTADNGLPQNSVRGIVQTQDGYLWLATFDGLVRFDGVRFTVFNKSNSPGIRTNRFNDLYEDANGDLWATTENSGITQLHQGRFTTYTTENGLPQNTVSSVGGDVNGNLFVSFGTDLYRWRDGKFERAVFAKSTTGAKSDWHKDQSKQMPYGYDFQSNAVYSFVNGELGWWRSIVSTQGWCVRKLSS